MRVNKALLKFGAIFVMGVGLIMVSGSWPPTAGLLAIIGDMIVWPIDAAQDLTSTEARLLLAIGGGMMVAWGLMIWFVAVSLADREPGLARTMVLVPLIVWFVLDSAGSIAAGVPQNVIFNIGFLVLLAAPFWPRRVERVA